MTINTLYLGLLIATLMQSSLLIAALLFNKKGNRLSNRLLTCIIVLFSYYMLIKVLCGTSLILDYPHLAQTYRPLPFLIWPAFYFYIKSMINPGFRFQFKECMHLIPFLLYALYLLPFFLAGGEVKLNSTMPLPGHYILAVVLQTTLLFLYIVQSYRILRSHQMHIQDIFSDIEKRKLNWLIFFLIAFGIIWAAAFINFVLGISYTGDFVIPPILLCLTIYGIGFYALKQPEIFKKTDIKIDPIKSKLTIIRPAATSPGGGKPLNVKNPPKYEFSTLTSQDLSEYGQKLIQYLKKEKPYTNSDLKLQDIAGFLKLPSHQLSQVINTQLKCNFYALINKYRIDQTKRQLIDPDKQHLNIIEIAYEAGFNSKSAFNTAFKKNTGMAPSQYRKKRLSRSTAA